MQFQRRGCVHRHAVLCARLQQLTCAAAWDVVCALMRACALPPCRMVRRMPHSTSCTITGKARQGRRVRRLPVLFSYSIEQLTAAGPKRPSPHLLTGGSLGQPKHGVGGDVHRASP